MRRAETIFRIHVQRFLYSILIGSQLTAHDFSQTISVYGLGQRPCYGHAGPLIFAFFIAKGAERDVYSFASHRLLDLMRRFAIQVPRIKDPDICKARVLRTRF